MKPVLFFFDSALILFIGMLVLVEVGRRWALRRARYDADGAWRGIGVVDGAVFGLLGLIVAFTFSGAVSRFDTRRNLSAEEANAIGTAYQRIDLVPSDAQAELRNSFRRYLDSRIQDQKRLSDFADAKQEFQNSTRLQTEIWQNAVKATQGSNTAAMLLLPALNQMFDITTTRLASLSAHPPAVIFIMLFGLALISALLAGYGMAMAKSRHWLHTFGFAAVTSLVFYVILNIEFPRLGLIRVDTIDQMLVDLRRSMD